jgi:hypothetical protein
MSPNYDPTWATNGKLDEAGKILFNWAKEKESVIKGLHVEACFSSFLVFVFSQQLWNSFRFLFFVCFCSLNA